MIDVDRYLEGAKHCTEIIGECDQCPVQEECMCEHWPRAFIKAVEQLKAEAETQKEAHKKGMRITELLTAQLTRAAVVAEFKALLEDRIGKGYHNKWNMAIRSMLYEVQQMERDKGERDAETD